MGGLPTGSSRSHENLPGAGGGRKYGSCRISVQIMILRPGILISLFEFTCVYILLKSSPPMAPQNRITNTNPISIKIRVAFAQLALLTGVPALKAQTNNIIKFTKGIHIRIIVMIQSPIVTID